MTGDYLAFHLSDSSYRQLFTVFLSTLDGHQSNLVSYHNDTLACSTSRFTNYSSVYRIVNIMSVVVPATVCLTFWVLWEPL